jgi:hypothetical protein
VLDSSKEQDTIRHHHSTVISTIFQMEKLEENIVV